ncbi:MAG: hypothetical protein IPI28_07315 [Candidatus Omnitrophica bacterium]|nr:hypothetical protein [Candidatus Omnitrophota bacterium]
MLYHTNSATCWKRIETSRYVLASTLLEREGLDKQRVELLFEASCHPSTITQNPGSGG